MFICPVCKTENETLLCKNCGFDGSCDFENYATLSMVPENLKAVDRKCWKRTAFAQTAADIPFILIKKILPAFAQTVILL